MVVKVQETQQTLYFVLQVWLICSDQKRFEVSMNLKYWYEDTHSIGQLPTLMFTGGGLHFLTLSLPSSW